MLGALRKASASRISITKPHPGSLLPLLVFPPIHRSEELVQGSINIRGVNVGLEFNVKPVLNNIELVMYNV